MDSDFSEDIISDDSGSEFGLSSPEKPKVKAVKKKTVKKKAPSKKPKKAVVESDFSESCDEAVVAGRNSIEKAALSKRFQKKNQLEHILLRADVYIGSPEKTEEKTWIFDYKTGKMVFKKITYSPGLYKIVDEILVNAADNKQRDPKMKSIKVNIDKESGVISVRNDGKGIPVEVHQEHKVYIPELIFGHLLTGENFEDTRKRVVGGKNGYGAKLANIFSQWFQIETVDSKSGLKYVQRWTDNMGKCEKPKITKAGSRVKDYTIVSFLPDFKRFQSAELEEDTYKLLCKRVHDIAGITHLSLKVHLNGKKLAVDRFENYVDMYIKALNTEDAKKTSSKSSNSDKSMEVDSDENSDSEKIDEADDMSKYVKVYEKINDFWEICITQSKGAFGHVSFVNSVCTYKGGKHVDYISDVIVNRIAAKLKTDKSMKGANLKNIAIKNNLFIFVNCLIVNPTFDSQSKVYLATTSSKFGDKENLPMLSDKAAKKLLKSSIIDSIKASVLAKNLRKIGAKTKTSKSGPLLIDKLDDANDAGTRKWKNCTLILTEGDSAKTFAVSGLSVVGRDSFGVFPLKGKLLNVREATTKQILANTEIQNICKIVGLIPGKEVDPSIFKEKKPKKGLRYGHIMIMTDQDHDGSHIKGLLFNFIHHYWPELMREVKDFLQVFITPIVKCTLKNSKPKKVVSFYTMPEYQTWCKENERSIGRYTIKYYKGLGTSSKAEAVEYFKALKKNRIYMRWDNSANVSDDAIKLAFSKKQVAERKKWLSDYNNTYGVKDANTGFVDFSTQKMTYSTFVNKELVQFSLADNIRSIPNMVDGFKPSQRKVVFAMFKKFLKRSDSSEASVKVFEFAGYVTGIAAYHHGEASLTATIVNLAQGFLGSNNINYLKNEGQFGTRMAGGKDAASGRYIFTGVGPLLTKIFRKEDECILEYLQEEGKSIEPEYFLPIIPMSLVNGAQGIGTGWSTEVPMHNPKDLVNWIRNRMHSDEGKTSETVEVHPWYRGFRGTILKTKETQYITRGVYELVEDQYKDEYYLKINELPVGKWTNDYKSFLMKQLEAEGNKDSPLITAVRDNGTDDTIDLKISLSKEAYDNFSKYEKQLVKYFHLEKTMSTTNMHLFDSEHKIKKYETQNDLLEEFYNFRLKKYKQRWEVTSAALEAKLNRLSNEERFVREVATGIISVTKRKKADLERELDERGYDRSGKNDVQAENEAKEDEEDADYNNSDSGNFQYLLKIPILSLTLEKVEKIRKQMEEMRSNYEDYKSKTVYDLWKSDLDDFMEAYEVFLTETDCNRFHQTTIVPDNLKSTSSSAKSSIADLSNDLASICEVSPRKKTLPKKTKQVKQEGPVEKKLKLSPKEKPKKNARKKTAMIVDSDISDLSLSEESDIEIPSKVSKVKATKKKQKPPNSSEMSSSLGDFTLDSSAEKKREPPSSPKPSRRRAKRQVSKPVYSFSDSEEEEDDKISEFSEEDSDSEFEE